MARNITITLVNDPLALFPFNKLPSLRSTQSSQPSLALPSPALPTSAGCSVVTVIKRVLSFGSVDPGTISI